jgi:tetratricopeptide (TPR) repeat protein
MIYYNNNETDKAKEAWDKIVKETGNTPEKSEALAHLKMLFINQGNVQQMQDYLTRAGIKVTPTALDSATFSVLKNDYINNNSIKTFADANDYIGKYPAGIFSGEAHYYRGKWYDNSKDYAHALEDYKVALGYPHSFFTEPALIRASQIAFNNKDYPDALSYYTQLELLTQSSEELILVRQRKMECVNELSQRTHVIGSADTLLRTPNVTKELAAEAYLLKAEALSGEKQYDSAMADFKQVTVLTKSEMEAEAMYYIAILQEMNGYIPGSEKTIFALVNQDPSYPSWMAKGLLILADDYTHANDDFQAKHTLTTVIENATDTVVVNLAKLKMAQILESERAKISAPVKDSMFIPINTDTAENNKLFKL